MTADPLDKIRGQLLAGVAREPARRRRRRAAVALATVVVGLGATGLVMASPWQDRADDAVVAGEGADGPHTQPDPVRPTTVEADGAIWSFEQPPAWDRAGRALMPSLGWDSLTAATFELRGGGERCAHLPEQALRDMGSGDALFSVFFVGEAGPSAAPWPESGDLAEALPIQDDHDALECAGRNDLLIHWGEVERAGIGMYVLVAFGSGAPPAVEDTAWRALSSLRPRDGVDPADVPLCVVTLPGDLRSVMPTTSGDGTAIDGEAWYGTPDLWTSLPIDGRHSPPRKSFWYSQHFPGGAEEERPDIAVTWRRLDAPAEPVTAGSPGTNAHGADAGWAMIAGIDPLEVGCWEVTATYKGHELSFVYWHRSVTVPDVVGRAVAYARNRLAEVALLGPVNDFDAPFDFALVIAQEPPPGSEVPSGAPVGLRTALPDPPQDQECPGTAHPRISESADGLPAVESVTRTSAAEAWAALPGREVDGAPVYLGKWNRQAWQRSDDGEVEIVPVEGYQLVVVHERAEDCPAGPISSYDGVPVTHWVLPAGSGG